MPRSFDKQLIYSHYDESASGALSYGDSGVVSNANLDQSVLVRGVNMESEPTVRDNTDRADAPEGLPDEVVYDRWNSRGSFSGEADVDLLAVVAGQAIGAAITSTPGGATDTRDHLIVPRSQAELDNPESLTFGFGLGSNYSKYPGCIITQLSIRGGKDQYVTMQADFVGNGRRSTMSAYTPPDAAELQLLRNSQGVVLLGTVGAPANIATKIREWSLTWRNEPISESQISIDMIAAYDVSDDDLGYGLSEQEIARRGLTFVIVVENDGLSEVDDMEALTARELSIVVEGDEIESGFNNTLTISAKDLRYLKVNETERNGLLAWELSGELLIDSSGTLADYLSLTVRNNTNAYGLLQA